MLGFLYRLIIGKFRGCDHKYECFKEIEVVRSKTGKASGILLIRYCTKCGRLKKYSFNIHS